ncbi:MAG: thioredoxin domain-containing protein, partial [Bacteroidota bacterium]
RFAVTVRETVEYVLRDLTSPEGAFYSAEDADSDGEEGTFYVWRVEELTDVLGEADGRFAAEAYGATLAGNFADEATGQRTGANVLHRIDAEPADEERLESVRRRLFEARGTRNRPLLDDKVLTDWNGLMIGSLAIASRHLSEPSYADAAVRAADFVWSHLRDSDGRLLHRYRAGTAGLQPTLDDYAFLAHGFIELYQTTFDHEHLARALQLTDEMTERFWDPEYDGFYLSPSDGEELLVRRKETYDGAIPSGASMALLNLVRLSRLTGRTDLDALADRHVRSIAGAIREVPNGHAMALVALDFLLGPSYEVTLAGSPAQIEPLLEAIRRAYVPTKVVLHRTAENADELAALAPFTRAQTEQSGRPTAYVCRNFACERPVTTPADLAEPFGGPTPFS